MIPGKEQVVQRIGKWPSFHDAEIVELKLVRQGESVLQIKTMYPPGEVFFYLENIVELELADFSEQNVIQDLHLEKDEQGVRLSLEPCYGLAGWIVAKTIRAK